ncbi:MAG: M1 family aminopeptidase [Chloroflexi bacterium]|nr:M1 family aminopeptidase [Chloroflexota bacterium]MCY3580986.1 M1 family aminopeptidase [Chloroflexota bacterium]MCY3715451.1 M1 family aminopeptidase [Chloroflexota bacterium]MDE2651147.1 M1 family aminopeptidase [Chloroflexota bacterium]
MIRACLFTLLWGFLLVGCNLSRATSATDATPVGKSSLRLEALQQQATPLTVPSEDKPTQPPPDPKPDFCPQALPEMARRIQAEVRVDFAAREAEVSQVITYHNLEAAPLHTLILDVQANQWEGSFALLSLRVNGESAEYQLELNRLDIQLATALQPGCWLELALTFQLRPSAIREGLRAYRGFFGHSPRQLNLSHFLPTVAARLSGEWRIHQPSGIGEQIVYAQADWRVHITAINASESLQLAAPGLVTRLGTGQWLVELPASRDFAISLSEEFTLVEREVAPGLTVAVYHFADAQVYAGGSSLDSISHLMAEAGKALELFAGAFGAYPYERFVIVQGDFPDGMEFTGLVFVGSAWFYGYDGGPKNYLTLIAVHEIAHQWWYARVGSDSALNPWLDEALATYSEYLYIEAFYPAERNWWWSFRVAGFFPQGKVDSAVYEFTSSRAYINAIYLRGVQMLQNLRDDIGDAAFMRLLGQYSQAAAGKIVDPAYFWSLLPAEAQPLTQSTRAEFLRQPDLAGQ